MAFSEPEDTNWGYILAALFLLVLGIPMVVAAGLPGSCADPTGCGDQRIVILIVVAGVAVSAFAIIWLTNFVIARKRR
jgi:hypothetical protein